MAAKEPHGKRRLSNIRPREVSLVDMATNDRDYIVVKRKQQDDVVKRLKEIPVEKRLALAVHKLTLSKNEFPSEEDVMKFFDAQGVDSEMFTKSSNDWEWIYEVTEKDQFEGSSLGYNWVHFNVGVDGSVGILKRMSEDLIAKSGTKISAKQLKEFRKVSKILDGFLGEFDTKEEDVSKQDKKDGATNDAVVEKSVDEKIAEVEKRFDDKMDAKDVEIAELKKQLEAKVETTDKKEVDTEKKEGDTEKKEGDPKEPVDSQETVIEKRLVTLEKKFDDALKTKEETITELKKRLKTLEDEPADGQSENPDDTEVEKNKESLWSNVL